VITARNEGEVTAAAQALTAAHAGHRAFGVVATASSAGDFERVYELTERELGP
jgi:Tfp pilus assembly pilus retraction ATPase PilT